MWSSDRERWLSRLSRRCRLEATLHERASRYFATWSKRLGLPTVLFAGATTLTVFGDSSDSDYWRWVRNGCSAVALILTSASQYLQLDRKRDNHMSMAAKYREIAIDVDDVLTRPASRRPKADDFGESIKERIKQLAGTALLPNNIMLQFSKDVRAELEEIVVEKPTNDVRNDDIPALSLPTTPMPGTRSLSAHGTSTPHRPHVVVSRVPETTQEVILGLSNRMEHMRIIENQLDLLEEKQDHL